MTTELSFLLDGPQLNDIPEPMTDMLIMTSLEGNRCTLTFENTDEYIAGHIFNPEVKTYLRLAWRAFKAHRKLRKKYKGGIDARYTTLPEIEREVER